MTREEELLEISEQLAQAELDLANEFNLAKALDPHKSDKRCEMEAIQATKNLSHFLKYKREILLLFSYK